MLVHIVQTLPVWGLSRLSLTHPRLAAILRPFLHAAHAVVPMWSIVWALRRFTPCWHCYNSLTRPFPHPNKGIHGSAHGWIVDVPRSLHDALLSGPRFQLRLCRLVPFQQWPMPAFGPNPNGRRMTQAVLAGIADSLSRPPGELERLLRFYAMDWLYTELRFRRLSNSAVSALNLARCVDCASRFPLHRDELRMHHWGSLSADRLIHSAPAQYRRANGPPSHVWWSGGRGGI